MKTKRFLTLAFCLIIASTMLFTTSCGAIKDLITGLVNTDEGGSDTREEINARAMEIRCFCPPETVTPRSPRIV